MILGLLFIGTAAGIVGAVISLLMGVSLGWAIIVYIIVGSNATLAIGFAYAIGKNTAEKIEGYPISLHFEEDCMWVHLDDGRILGVPLTWFPSLNSAIPEQRAAYELKDQGIYWKLLDMKVNVSSLLAGQGRMAY